MVEKVDFIKEDLIFSLLEKGKITDRNEIREILAKARECKGISLGEVAKLLYLEDEELLEELYDVANSFKVFREAYLLCGNYPPLNMYMLQHFMNNNSTT